jgi:TPR repeat protein
MSNAGHARAFRLAVFMVACLFGRANLGFAAESSDADQAAKLFKQALALRAQGHALEPQTIKLLQDAANLGQTEAQDIIGQLYLNGAGLPRDSAKAFNWFKRAAEGGLAMGQDHLANLYENGVSTTTNLVLAFVLFQKAAEQGLADAEFDLAQVYREGRGVPTNNAFALRWYLKAALQGHPGAQVNLAGMYAEGEGVPRDVEEAYKWLTLAILSGHPVADRNRKSLALTMSPEQIYEARKRVDAFRSATNSPATPVNHQK